MNTKLRLILLTSTTLKAVSGFNGASAQEFKPVWTPAKIGGNSYRIRTGIKWHDDISGGAELAVVANTQSVVSKIPVALWGQAQLNSSLPMDGALSQTIFARIETQVRQTSLEYSCQQVWNTLGGLQLVGSSFIRTGFSDLAMTSLSTGQVLKLKVPDEGFTLAVSGTLTREAFYSGVSVEKGFSQGLSAKAAIRGLESVPKLSLRINYRRQW